MSAAQHHSHPHFLKRSYSGLHQPWWQGQVLPEPLQKSCYWHVRYPLKAEHYCFIPFCDFQALLSKTVIACGRKDTQSLVIVSNITLESQTTWSFSYQVSIKSWLIQYWRSRWIRPGRLEPTGMSSPQSFHYHQRYYWNITGSYPLFNQQMVTSRQSPQSFSRNV